MLTGLIIKNCPKYMDRFDVGPEPLMSRVDRYEYKSWIVDILDTLSEAALNCKIEITRRLLLAKT